MAVSNMKRLSVFAAKEDLRSIISKLMELRCVEVSEAPFIDDDGQAILLEDALLNEKSVVEKKIARINEALSLTHKYAKGVKSIIDPKVEADIRHFDDTSEYVQAEKLLCSVLKKGDRLTEIKNELARDDAYLKSLLPWAELDIPLSQGSTKNTSILLGTFGAGVKAETVREALCEMDVEFFAISEGTTLYGSMLHLTQDSEAVMSAILPLGFIRASFSEGAGLACEEIRASEGKIKALEKEQDGIISQIKKDAESLVLLEILSDFEKTKRSALYAIGKSGHTTFTSLICGYIPSRAEARLEKVLAKYDCSYELEEIADGEDAPIELRNNSFSSCFEWVLGMYSYPAYGRFDPTVIMSIFYFAIFGLMFADAGYGLLLVLGCFGAIRFMNPKPGMKSFLSMFGYCGFASIVWGVLFGSYFGDFPLSFMNNMTSMAIVPDQIAIWFDPLKSPMNFLILSIAVGAIHLLCGMGVRAYILCKDGKVLDAIFDIGSWWVLFLGIGLYFTIPSIGLWVAIAGVAMLVLTQGRNEKNIIMKLFKGVASLYDIIAYLSDLLSYSRILALGLASAVIAQVVNILATLGGPSVGGFIGMILIFIFGHILNLAINVLGTFVHTARLQYIEFFGKFYEDGGRPFRPLTPTEDYTYKINK